MAKRSGKSPSRLELRKAGEAAERLGKDAKKKVASKEKVAKKAPKKKAARKKKTKGAATAERLRMVWGVFDNSNQQVAAFPYSNRADAEKKVEDMAGKGRGPYFIQPVKEPILESDDEATSEEE